MKLPGTIGEALWVLESSVREKVADVFSHSPRGKEGHQKRPFNLSGHSYALAGVLCYLWSGRDSSQPGYCSRRFTTLPTEFSTPNSKQRPLPARIYKYWKERRRERKRRLFMFAVGYFPSRYSRSSAEIL